jgi:hypothetical protein
MKATILEIDLDKAIAEVNPNPRPEGYCHTCHCLMAQFAKRITGEEVWGTAWHAASLVSGSSDTYSFRCDAMSPLAQRFDEGRYDEVRAQLPMDVEYFIDENRV